MHAHQYQMPGSRNDADAQRERFERYRAVILGDAKMPAEEFMRLVQEIRENGK